MADEKLTLVSVIIPVYQVSDYVERCLLSVMNQTYMGIECIIVNDATVDDSIKKCERLIESYQGPIKFKILHHKHNRGLSAARNTGTNVALGDYLYYLDSDDEITPDCIEKLVSYVIEDDSIEMVQGGHLRICNGKEEARKTDLIRIVDNNVVRKLYYDRHAIQVYVWNKLLKRSFVIENALYCTEGIIYEDDLWTFYLLKHLTKACLCDSITYNYVVRPNSIMTGSNKQSVGESLAIVYNNILNNLTKGKAREELHGNLYTFCKRYLLYVDQAPALSSTLALYRRRAKQLKSWQEYLLLSIVGKAGGCRFLNSVLQKQN